MPISYSMAWLDIILVISHDHRSSIVDMSIHQLLLKDNNYE
jgi:hypothetical protein